MEVVDGELNVFSRDLYRVYFGLVGVINHTNYHWSPGWEKEVNVGRIRDVYGRKVSLYFTAFVCSAVCASAELCVFAVTLPSFLPSSRLLRLLACTLAHAMWQSQTESRQADRGSALGRLSALFFFKHLPEVGSLTASHLGLFRPG